MNSASDNLVHSPTACPHGSVTLTKPLKISVSPSFIPEHSDPDTGRWIFAYKIEITNEGDVAWTLRSRYWKIIDGDGEQHEVRGPGVVGLQPRIEGGLTFSYSSFCPLSTTWGTMEGSFRFVDDEGSELIAGIDRFFLAID